MQTAPKPLRRKAVISKPADSRYVSLFSDANNKADITFSDAHKGLLPKSTKLYEVGIDNLTLSMNGLSMLSPSNTEPVILEILALRTYQNQIPGGNPQNWEEFPVDFRPDARDYQVLDTDIFTSMAQLMHRLDQISEDTVNDQGEYERRV